MDEAKLREYLNDNLSIELEVDRGYGGSSLKVKLLLADPTLDRWAPPDVLSESSVSLSSIVEGAVR